MTLRVNALGVSLNPHLFLLNILAIWYVLYWHVTSVHMNHEIGEIFIPYWNYHKRHYLMLRYGISCVPLGKSHLIPKHFWSSLWGSHTYRIMQLYNVNRYLKCDYWKIVIARGLERSSLSTPTQSNLKWVWWRFYIIQYKGWICLYIKKQIRVILFYLWE